MDTVCHPVVPIGRVYMCGLSGVENVMKRIWLLRGICLSLVAITLGGCIIEPVRPFRPVYYYR